MKGAPDEAKEGESDRRNTTSPDKTEAGAAVVVEKPNVAFAHRPRRGRAEAREDVGLEEEVGWGIEDHSAKGCRTWALQWPTRNRPLLTVFGKNDLQGSVLVSTTWAQALLLHLTHGGSTKQPAVWPWPSVTCRTTGASLLSSSVPLPQGQVQSHSIF
jgi:hypothetical protein